MTMKKGLAVISSGGDTKHRLVDTATSLTEPMATLGDREAALSSSIHTSVKLKNVAGSLASAMNTSDANVNGASGRIAQSESDRNDIRTELDSVADALEVTKDTNAAGTGRYAYLPGGSATVSAAASFAGADKNLAISLSGSSETIAMLKDAETVPGSVDDSIRKWLLGGANGTAVQTMSALSASMLGDQTLSSSIMTAIGDVKTRIKADVTSSLDSLKKIVDAKEYHEDNAVVTAKARLNDRLLEVAKICDVAATDGSNFDYSVTLNDSYSTAGTLGTATPSTLLAADVALDKEHAVMRRRYMVFVGEASDSGFKGIETQALTVAGDTSADGLVSFSGTTDVDMAVPVYTDTTLVPASGSANGQIMYLDDDNHTPSDEFPANKKFYFCESNSGNWFPSPFHSEE